MPERPKTSGASTKPVHLVTVHRASDHRFLSRQRLERLFAFILAEEGRSVSGKLEISGVKREAIRQLKRDHFGIDQETDVIAFPYGESEPDAVWGELILCPSFIQAEARKRGIDTDQEYLRVTIHGLLHLLGYDDTSPAARAQMEDRQEKVLDLFRLLEEREKLVALAVKARQNAYVPGSRFRVGAALIADQTVYTGCNIENASYGLTVCAERVAVFKAVSAGQRVFQRLAVLSDDESFCFPCGACRQVLVEFGPDLEILCGNDRGEYQVLSLAELMPFPFRFSHDSTNRLEEL